MATSGYKEITVTSHHKLKFSWSLKSQSVVNNTSSVSWNMKLIADSYGNMSTSTPKAWNVTVNGTKYSGTVSLTHSAGETLTLASGTTTIKHNSNGTKSFSYSFSQEFNITYISSKIGTFSGSGTGELTTIPRASSITATNAYIESATTITISRASSSFTHILQYKIGSQTSYKNITDSKITATSYKWTIPKEAYNEISATGKTVSISIKCITYSGSTKLGEATKTITATCNESKCKPTLTPVVTDAGKISTELTGDANTVIKGYNKFSYDIGATAKNGATIKSRKITAGSVSATDASGYLPYVDSNKFVITAKDSRGFSNTTTITKSIVNYVKVSCNLVASAELNSSNNTATVNISISGNWFNGSFGAVANTITVQYRYKTNSGSYGSWTSVTPTKSGNTYKATKTLTGLDYGSTYKIEARAYDIIHSKGASDNFGLASGGTKTVSAKPVFEWGKDDFKFNVPVDLVGNTYSSAYAMNCNNSDIWGVNGIIFADKCSGVSEGIKFPTDDSSGTYDRVAAYDGNIAFYPKDSSTGYKLFYTAGDSVTFPNLTAFPAFLSNSSKDILITIPLTKPAINATNVTLSGTIICRGCEGYVYNPKDSEYGLNLGSPNGFTFTTVAVYETHIFIRLNFSSALKNGDGSTYKNNSSVSACCASSGLKLTFK